MASKLLPFTVFRFFPRCILLTSHFFTGACSADAANSPENDRQDSNPTDFDSAVCLLKRKLHPDNLAWFLGSIPDLASVVSLFRWASSQKRFRHTGTTYAAVILRLGVAEKSEEMDDILKEMVRLGPPYLDETLEFLIREFVGKGMAKKALRVFEVACCYQRWPQISVCNDLLRILVSGRGNFGRIVFVYKEMVKAGLLPDVDTLNYLIQVLLETGRIDSAVEQYHRMPRKRCFPNCRTFELIIGGLCLGGRVEESIKILSEMYEMGINPNAEFYHHAVPLFCNVGKIEEALELFRSMRASEIIPDSHIFTALVRKLSEIGRLDIALELSEEMLQKGLLLDVCAYVEIIVGFCKVGRFSNALTFLEMYPSTEVEPYNALLKCCCGVGRFQDAVTILQRLLKMNLCDGTSWNILTSALFQEGHTKLAYSVLARMITSSYMVDGNTYSIILSGHCRQGEMKHAIECLYQLQANNWSLDMGSYNQLIVGLCRTDNISKASEVFYYMSSKGGVLEESSLNSLISGVCLLGDFRQAINIRLLASCNGTSNGPKICSTIMQYFLAEGKSKHILVLFGQMLVEGCTFDTSAQLLLLRRLLAENMTREVVVLFDLMISDGQLHDPVLVNVALSHLSDHCQLHSVMHSLDKLFRKIGPVCSSSFNLVISGLLKEGHRSEACRYLELMLDRGWVPDVYTHGLLFGKVSGNTATEVSEGVSMDTITSILDEGLKDAW